MREAKTNRAAPRFDFLYYIYYLLLLYTFSGYSVNNVVILDLGTTTVLID